MVKSFIKKCTALNIVVNLYDLELGNSFLDMTPKTQAAKENNRYMGVHQNLKHLCFKGHFQKAIKLQKIFANLLSDERRVFRI